MAAVICMLRGVNVGGHNKIRMEKLRAVCESLNCEKPQTYVQSGNVVFATAEKNLKSLAAKIEAVIEKELGFRPAVMLRTADEMKEVIARNPFAKRKGIDPAKLAVVFLADEIAEDQRKQLESIRVGPEETKAFARELYIYFPEGMGRSKVPAAMERVLKKTGTARNWNTVTKMMEMAEKLEQD